MRSFFEENRIFVCHTMQLKVREANPRPTRTFVQQHYQRNYRQKVSVTSSKEGISLKLGRSSRKSSGTATLLHLTPTTTPSASPPVQLAVIDFWVIDCGWCTAVCWAPERITAAQPHGRGLQPPIRPALGIASPLVKCFSISRLISTCVAQDIRYTDVVHRLDAGGPYGCPAYRWQHEGCASLQ